MVWPLVAQRNEQDIRQGRGKLKTPKQGLTNWDSARVTAWQKRPQKAHSLLMLRVREITQSLLYQGGSDLASGTSL